MSSNVRVAKVPVDKVTFHTHNVRRDLGDLRTLAASIKRFGVMQPIVVEDYGDQLRLRAGHRRLAAARSSRCGTSAAPGRASATRSASSPTPSSRGRRHPRSGRPGRSGRQAGTAPGWPPPRSAPSHKPGATRPSAAASPSRSCSTPSTPSPRTPPSAAPCPARRDGGLASYDPAVAARLHRDAVLAARRRGDVL